MNEDRAIGIVCGEVKKLGPMDPRTCRSLAAYAMATEADGSIDYVRRFGAALGLTPTPTRFGERVVLV